MLLSRTVGLGLVCGLAAPALSLSFPFGAAARPALVREDEWDVEYAVTARLELADTPLGQGDGVYSIGPGHLTLRFEDRDGQPGGRVKMISYEMPQAFTVVSKTLFWKTTVTTRATTLGVLDPCGEPEGHFDLATVAWSTPVRNMQTDGTLTCSGAFCGEFGAPPPGESRLHIGPDPVSFQPFRFSADMKTFTMGKTFVAKTQMPKQTSYIALAGRETRRTSHVKSCP